MPPYSGNGHSVKFAFISLLLLPAMAAAQDIDAASGLIKKPGWEQVRAHCGACHSHALVTAQRADRNTWLNIIRWMQETQNLWQFQPQVETQILDYLTENYPPQASRRRAPIPPSLMPKATESIQ
jgi:hypothetical protein